MKSHIDVHISLEKENLVRESVKFLTVEQQLRIYYDHQEPQIYVNLNP